MTTITFKKLVFILFSSILFSNCASIGTKTLFKTYSNEEIKKIGFTDLDGKQFVTKIFPQTDSIFKYSFVNSFEKTKIGQVYHLNEEIAINKPDTSKIKELCKLNNLDGIIISKLNFIHVTYRMGVIPIIKNYDTNVEMKLIDKNGTLILNVNHNTLHGNSYFMPPKADKTIYDGTAGAIKGMGKEFGWLKEKR